MMALLNDIEAKGSINTAELKTLLILLSPFAPHIAEEIWEACGLGSGLVCHQPWPDYDEAKCVDSEVEMAVQVLGKIRARMMVPADAAKEQVLVLAKHRTAVAAEIAAKTVCKRNRCAGKLVNFVVK
jgi:leucyl-tRNA synthetase